ncbi:P-loop containing nucleoside triphosphate hydrolase protein, partial [Suillus spraguei]
FYLDGRTKVAFPHHQSPTYPVMKSLAEWDTLRSTKVDTLIMLLAWHLESDEHVTFDIDEETTKGAGPPPSNQLADPLPATPNAKYIAMLDLMMMGTRKILVYIEFPMMAPLLLSLLKLHNINALIIHGSHGADEQNETVLQFHSDPNVRVLIFSSVGAVRLNLTAATVVVLFDQCWSRMLVNQIIGRAWCLGQQKEVVVYNMVSLGTVDVLMLHHGEGKGNMLNQFLSANKGTYAFHAFVSAVCLHVGNRPRQID